MISSIYKSISQNTPKHLPTFLVGFFLLALPFQTRFIFSPGTINGEPWEYGTLSIYFSDFILCALSLWWIFVLQKNRDKHVMVSPSNHNIQKNSPNTKITHTKIAVSALWLITFTSIVWSKQHTLAAFGILQITKAALVFFIFSSANLSKKLLAWIFVISGIIQSLFITLQFLTQRIASSTILGMSAQSPETLGVSVIETNAGRFLRAYGTLPHPNVTAGFLVITLFFTGFLVTTTTTNDRARNTATEFTSLVASIFITFALTLTFSRAAIIGLLAGLILCTLLTTLIHAHARRQARTWLITTFISLILFVCALLPLYLLRFTTSTRLEHLSTTARIESIEQSLTILTTNTNWFTGVGISNYTQAVYNIISDQKPGWWYQPVHSTPLLVLAELGLVGFLLFLSLFLFTLQKTFTWILSPATLRTQDTLTPFLHSILFGLFILSFFDHYLWTLPTMLLTLFLLFGLTEKPAS